MDSDDEQPWVDATSALATPSIGETTSNSPIEMNPTQQDDVQENELLQSEDKHIINSQQLEKGVQEEFEKQFKRLSISSSSNEQAIKSSMDDLGAFRAGGDDDEELHIEQSEAEQAEDGDEDDDFGDFEEVKPISNPPNEERWNSFTIPTTSIHPEVQTDDGFGNHGSKRNLRILSDDDFASYEDLERVASTIADDIFPSARMIAASLDTYDDLEPVSPQSANNLSDSSQRIWDKLRQEAEAKIMDWRTSKIRRTYLVSLGLPVDLDQIFQTKVAEKLIVSSNSSKRFTFQPRPLSRSQSLMSKELSSHEGSTNGDGSEDTEQHESVSEQVSQQLRHQSQLSNKSDSIAQSNKSSKNNATVEPDFDADYARQLSRVSGAALDNMTYDELANHVAELERVKIEASMILAYWIDMRNSRAEDKSKYESVIESSIEYAQRLRKNTTRLAAVPRPRSVSRTRSFH
ncbi:hypothetical protein V1511DRAFT_507389, partial [Dipodascopsis uninucleata]